MQGAEEDETRHFRVTCIYDVEATNITDVNDIIQFHHIDEMGPRVSLTVLPLSAERPAFLRLCAETPTYLKYAVVAVVIIIAHGGLSLVTKLLPAKA